MHLTVWAIMNKNPTGIENMESVSIARYCGVFSIIYAVLIIVINVLDRSGVDLGNAVTTASLITAVYGASAFFVRDHGRVPDSKERRRLAWGSIFISYLISIVIASFLLSLEGTSFGAVLGQVSEKITPVLLSVAIIIVTLIYYLFLGLCYRVFSGIALRGLRSRNQ